MTAIETLRQLKDALFIAQKCNLTKEQIEAFEFVEERLRDGAAAENAMCEIECICAKAEGEI